MGDKATTHFSSIHKMDDQEAELALYLAMWADNAMIPGKICDIRCWLIKYCFCVLEIISPYL